MTGSRVWSVLLSTALLCSLAACGGKDTKTSDVPTPEPTKSASPTPTPTPTTPSGPKAIPAHASEKYGDLTLVLNRPAKMDPKLATPVRLFQEMHQYAAVMLSGQPQPPEMAEIADPRVITFWNGVLAADKKAKQHGGGTLTVNVTTAQGGSAIAAVNGCFDQRQLLTIRRDGTTFVDPTVKKQPKIPVRMTLSRGMGLWKITDYSFGDGTC
ncbi:hypothetical protein OG474_24570 [Kribbella sp. NBC_01505]|uniref:hypothetical protein n=1 Tax=Kribbella sp. NBC_01505 TaxID=2903580 RepID=UPI003862DAAF